MLRPCVLQHLVNYPRQFHFKSVGRTACRRNFPYLFQRGKCQMGFQGVSYRNGDP